MTPKQIVDKCRQLVRGRFAGREEGSTVWLEIGKIDRILRDYGETLTTDAIKADPEHLIALAISGALPEEQARGIMEEAFTPQQNKQFNLEAAQSLLPDGYVIVTQEEYKTILRETDTAWDAVVGALTKATGSNQWLLNGQTGTAAAVNTIATLAKNYDPDEQPEHEYTEHCGFDRNGSLSNDTYVCTCGWPFSTPTKEEH